MQKSASSPRHIHFAPLSDPRGAVFGDTHLPAATSVTPPAIHDNHIPQTQKQAITPCSNPGPPPEQFTSWSPSPALSSPTDLQASSNSTPYSPSPQSIHSLGPISSSVLLSDQPNFKENDDSHRNSLNAASGQSGWTSSIPLSSNNTQTEGNIPPLSRSQCLQDGSDFKKLELNKPRTEAKTSQSIHTTPSPSPFISGTSSSAFGSAVTNESSATPTQASVLLPPQQTPQLQAPSMLNGHIDDAELINRIVEWRDRVDRVKEARSASVVWTNGQEALPSLYGSQSPSYPPMPFSSVPSSRFPAPVSLHRYLLPNAIHWDLREYHSTRTHGGSRLSSSALQEPAREPHLPFMDIFIQMQVSYEHPHPFWVCTVRASNRPYVTVFDVLEGLYRALRVAITRSEFQSLSDTDRRLATRAYKERYRRLRDPLLYEKEKRKGPKRIDFLLDRKRFGGVSARARPDGFDLQVARLHRHD